MNSSTTVSWTNQAPAHNTNPTDTASFLIGLVRDPEWIFLFWTLSDSDQRKAIDSVAGETGPCPARRKLRLLDVTDIEYDGKNSWRTYDTAIDNLTDNWYLKVPEAGRDYLVELGYLLLDGNFAAIVRSNLVRMPAGRVSDEVDEKWATIDTASLIRISTNHRSSDFGSSGMPLQNNPYLGSGADNS